MSKKHPAFVKYMKYIVNHNNYKTQPCRFNKDGNITWVKTGKSCPERITWWDNQIIKYNLTNRADVARYIHPKELKGMKPCSECGKQLSIFYIYPGNNLLKKINKFFSSEYKLYEEDIFQIINAQSINNKEDMLRFFIEVFKIYDAINSIEDLINYLNEHHTQMTQKGKMLSPGVMSNPPDRFDGFHTYNGCCRKEKDTGRHDENMKNYTRDRRAFEKWADGNFTLANQIMGEFLKYEKAVICPGCGENQKMSADHIGPISLGFCHRKEFNPLCSSCNSAKNNRMTLNDVITLLNDEDNGKEVISWHSKFLWDKLKYLIHTDEEAKIASSIMRENIHYILASLNIIYQYKNGYDFLLTKLHPEYVKYKYKITNFNPLALNEMIITSTISKADTKTTSEKRYIEISFEELEKYNEKENRIYNEKLLGKYSNQFTEIKNLLLNHDFEKVNEKLSSIFQSIASELEQKFKNC